MSGMASALEGDWRSPPIPFSQQIPQTLAPGSTTPALMYQLQQASQFAGQTPGQSPHYGAQYQNYTSVYQSHQGYPQMLPSPQQQGGGPGSGQQSFIGHQFFPQQPQYAPDFTHPQPMPRVSPYQQQFPRRDSGSYGQGPLQDQRGLSGTYGVSDPGASAAYLQPGPGQSMCSIFVIPLLMI